MAKIDALSKPRHLLAGSKDRRARGQFYSCRGARDRLSPSWKERSGTVGDGRSWSAPRVRGSHEQMTVLFRALLSNALSYRGKELPTVHITAQRKVMDGVSRCETMVSALTRSIGIKSSCPFNVFTSALHERVSAWD